MEQTTKKKIMIAGIAFLVILIVILLLVTVYHYVIKGRDNLSADRRLQTFPLKWGVGSSLSLDPEEAKNNVKVLQGFLNSAGASLVVDGIWGANTENAVASLRNAYPQTASWITPVTDPINALSHWEITKESIESGRVSLRLDPPQDTTDYLT